jgi:hypothetical protein
VGDRVGLALDGIDFFRKGRRCSGESTSAVISADSLLPPSADQGPHGR